MWIQVRSMDGRKSVRVDSLSKLTAIEQLRERLVKEFGAEPSRQRLFYRGKQLEDGNTLFDYAVGLNDIVQIIVRAEQPLHDSTNEPSSCEQNSEEKMDTDSGVGSSVSEESVSDGLYVVGEKIDARDLRMGAWFEAQVVKVTKEVVPSSDQPPSSSTTTDSETNSTIYYHVRYDDYSEDDILKLTAVDIRPRARYLMQWEQLAVDQVVMVNFNPDHPRSRGYWYDGLVTRKVNDGKKLYCKLILSSNQDLSSNASQDCLIKFVDEVFRIESKESPGELTGDGQTRTKKPDCDFCKDVPTRKCKHCACSVCGGKESPDQQILCDECDMAYHLWCLEPALESIPDSDEWYCPECKTDTSEVILAGEKMRITKKKANMVSRKSGSGRDWGKGMACVGRTRVCTLVPSNHFGAIPGVPVGTMWKFRVQVSEAGVHRPHVAGIHGRENEGAYSIVLSGGYEDDEDNGDEFVYSGSGGRDLSGNKRTAKQSMDQKLTAMNRAMAKNCDAPINTVKGASASKWQNGKPIRVVRNHKGRKASDYCPEEGNRYDGIYKVAKYWPQKNSDGLLVWKYLLRRDDPSSSPWSKEGKKLAKKLGLTMQYPDGYLDSSAQDTPNSEEDERDSKARKRKRKSSGESSKESPLKSKQPRYELSRHQRSLIKLDTVNQKLWEEVLEYARSVSSVGLLAQIQEVFNCIVCQELVHQPVSTPCSHNICKACLIRSFKVEVFTCPNCRHPLGKEYDMVINQQLQDTLLDLFPGYDGGR